MKYKITTTPKTIQIETAKQSGMAFGTISPYPVDDTIIVDQYSDIIGGNVVSGVGSKF